MRTIIATMLGMVLLAGAALAEEAPRTITVTGEGSVEAVPDMATISIGVTTQAAAAREAIDANSRSMSGVLARLEGAGIAPRDLQTSGFSVSPRWENRSGQAPRITGFIAQNTLTVRVRELDRLGGILDEVARDGANSFNELQFGLQEPGPRQDAAREAAVRDARRKAALYAEAAGVTLGPLMALHEAGGGPVPMPLARAEMAMVSDAVPVAAGEVSLSARVTLVYAIAD